MNIKYLLINYHLPIKNHRHFREFHFHSSQVLNKTKMMPNEVRLVQVETRLVPSKSKISLKKIIFCFNLAHLLAITSNCGSVQNFVDPSERSLHLDENDQFTYRPTPSLDKIIFLGANSRTNSDLKFEPSEIQPSSVDQTFWSSIGNPWSSPVWFDNYLLSDANLPVLATIRYHDSQNAHARATDVEPDSDGSDQNGNSALDFIDQGSGFGWIDEASSFPNSNTNQPNLIQPTPVITDSSGLKTAKPNMMTDLSNSVHDKPPMLTQRLPKLIITAGRVWRYFIPYDTFKDEEDGDLRHLKSIVMKNSTEVSNLLQANTENSLEPIGDFYSWLQYDQSAKLLYALPTDRDLGIHKLVFMVSDQANQVNQDTFEIAVRQHQSTRAFTHTFTLNQIQLDKTKFASLIDAMGELIKRISTQLFIDHPFKNLIIHSYQVLSQNPSKDLSSSVQDATNSNGTPPIVEQQNLLFNLVWSNASVPIHPCNLSELDQMARRLIDTRVESIPISGSDWLIQASLMNKNFTPSSALIQALGSEFSPTSISIQLRGACESSGLNSISLGTPSVELAPPEFPRVHIKIGKLNWVLGVPVEYQIPPETFEATRADKQVLNSANFNLTLHTIDGLTLDKDPRYNFIEFDADTQTIIGLPYSLSDHIGQRELQLTAYDPLSGQKVREVFIVNVEAQDLTLRDNRAFRMSLYLVARTKLFGPRERVSLCHKIMASLRLGDASFRQTSHMGEAVAHHELVVIDVQKFVLDSVKSNVKFSLFPSFEDLSQYPKILRISDIDSNDPSVDTLQINSKSDGNENPAATLINRDDQSNFLYKFIWTNETIGYRGDCPVEVIEDNILNTLEQFNSERYAAIDIPTQNHENSKTGQARFYERLKRYFEPESSLLHLRFEPLGACLEALQLHDVGNGDLADQVDRAGAEPTMDPSAPLDQTSPDVIGPMKNASSAPSSIDLQLADPQKLRPSVIPGHYEEYWLIFAIIVALLFVIIMFALGMHTYKVNQEKSFELQVRLAQARQSSMFLSSMVLTNQLNPTDITSQQQQQKSYCVVQSEEKGSRKPVILDSEKEQLLYQRKQNVAPITPVFRPTTVRLMDGQAGVQTLALAQPLPHQLVNGSTGMVWNEPRVDHIPASITLDQLGPSPSMSAMISNPIPYHMMSPNQSLTLHRRFKQPGPQPMIPNQSTVGVNNSQSIITVGSLSDGIRGAVNSYPGANLKMTNGNHEAQFVGGMMPLDIPNGLEGQRVFDLNSQVDPVKAGIHNPHRASSATRSSSSYSSSTTSATVQSVISNPNFVNPNLNLSHVKRDVL